MDIDIERVAAFAGEVADHMAGATTMAMVHIGDELGLYQALAGAGPLSAEQLADATGCNPRLVLEWLRQQTAAGLLRADETAEHFELPAEHAAVLAWEQSPAFLAGGTGMFRAMFSDLDGVMAAFRGDGGMPWGDHHPCLFTATSRFFRTHYEAHLLAEWIPALDGVAEQLRAGATAIDVGCGQGDTVRILAAEFGESVFTGVDFHAPSVAAAQQQSTDAGLTNTRFEVADAQGYDGAYDVVFFFDCLHDMGDPVGAARHARSRITDGGSVVVVEPFALDDHTSNIAENPMAATAYGASAVFCTPCSLSQPPGRGMGAQSGPKAMQAVFAEAGFSRFQRVAETSANIVYQAHV